MSGAWRRERNYTLHRHYDPVLMRFTSLDPAASPFFNLAAYVGNNPARFFDPDGLEKKTEEYEKPMLSRWAYFLFFDYQAGGKKGEHARDTFNARALNFLTVGTAISDEEVAQFDELAEYEGYGDVVARSDDAFETTKFMAYLIPGPTGTIMYGLDISNRLADGEGLEPTDALILATRIPGLRGAGRGRGVKPPKPPKPACFVEGTQVLAADETGTATATNIEEIEVGDWVWSRNEQTGEEGFKPVVRLFRNQADTLVHLTYTTGSAPRNVETGAASASARWTFDHTDGSRIATGTRRATITGTPEHPFWSLTRQGWIGMGELEAGERLQLAGGQTATATAIRIEHLATPVTVYNFEVADWHTYHVGTAETGWVYVHNLCQINVLREVRRNADMAVRAANRTAASGKITNTPQAIGSRAHLHFRRLNEKLNDRLIASGSKYRVSAEEFRNAMGRIVPRNSSGSIGADVRITGGRRTRIYDLKVHGGSPRPMSAARHAEFLRRFRASVRELYKQR